MKWLSVKCIRLVVDYKCSVLREKREMDDAHQVLHLSVSRVLCLDFLKSWQFVQSCVMFFTYTTEHSDFNGSKETRNVLCEGT